MPPTTPRPSPSPLPHPRSLYRAFLRELPASASPGTAAHLRHRLRTHFAGAVAAGSGASQGEGGGKVGGENQVSSAASASSAAQAAAAEQHLHFLRAQRTYSALLERYNPGMAAGGGGGAAGLDSEVDADRVRASARRVGVELPSDPGRREGGGE